jgi:hypothetical protein
MTRLVPFLAAVVACPAAGAPIPDEARGPVLYHPTRVGDRMTYQTPYDEVVRVVTAVERKGDARVVSVGYVWKDGRVTPLSKVEVSAKGVLVLQQVVARDTVNGPGVRITEARFEERVPPHPILKMPCPPGQKWEGPSGRGLPASFIPQREEAVKVPAGEFRAIPVEVTVAAGQDDHEPQRYWFAPGVGVVKWVTAKGYDVVLKSFTPGRP